MVAVNVNLELIHVEQLQDRRHDEDKSKQDLEYRFAYRGSQNGLIVVVEQVFPPTVFLAHDFLRLVGTRRAVLDGIVVLAQFYDFLILYGGALAISRLLA